MSEWNGTERRQHDRQTTLDSIQLGFDRIGDRLDNMNSDIKEVSSNVDKLVSAIHGNGELGIKTRLHDCEVYIQDQKAQKPVKTGYIIAACAIIIPVITWIADMVIPIVKNIIKLGG